MPTSSLRSGGYTEMHNYKKINYSKMAIKTEKGWFAGWDQFGKAKFMESVELAELSSPQMAEVTASKLEKEGMETELAAVYVENDAVAVKWDEGEFSDYTFREARRMLKTFDTVVYMEGFKIREILEVEGYDDESDRYKYVNIYRHGAGPR